MSVSDCGPNAVPAAVTRDAVAVRSIPALETPSGPEARVFPHRRTAARPSLIAVTEGHIQRRGSELPRSGATEPRIPPTVEPLPTFAAIDFETADERPDSACAVGVARVVSGRVASVRSWLIRPPRPAFRFTGLHGIDWSSVSGAPGFGEVWPEVELLITGATFLAAHNAAFDRRVLGACCRAASMAVPRLPFACTRSLAARVFGRPTTLDAVCERLGIALIHHDAGSDAHACARIVIAAFEVTGERPNEFVE